MKKNMLLKSMLLSLAMAITACGGSEGGGSTSDGGGPRYQLTKLNDVTNADMQKVAVAYDNAGNAMAVWVAWNGSEATYLAAYYDAAAGSWSEETRLADGGFTPDPIAIASNGTSFMAVYSSYGMVYAKLFTGGAWEAETLLRGSTDFGNHLTPRIASNGATYMAVWDYADQIKASIYTPGSPGSWSSPAAIELASGDAKEPQITSDGSGYAVVWYQFNTAGTGWDIYANIYSGGAWGSEMSIAAAGGEVVTYYRPPQVASDGSGYAAIWSQFDGPSAPYPSVFARLYINGILEAETKLSTDAIFSNSGHIASNGSGYGAAWYENGDIRATVYQGGSWATSTLLSSVYSQNNPWVSSDGSGYLVNWQQRNAESGYDLYGSIFTPGAPGSWSAAALVEAAAGTTLEFAPPVGSHDGSNYVCLWGQFNGIRNTIYHSSLSGSTWNTPTELLGGTVPGGVGYYPRLAGNNNGDLLAVWDQFDNGRWHVYARPGTNGTWGDITRLTTTGSPDKMAPDVASNGTDFMVAWESENGRDAVGRSYSTVLGWGADTVLDNLTGYESVTSVRIASNGAGYGAGWSQYTGGVWRAYAIVYANDAWSVAQPIESVANGALNLVIAANGSGYGAAWSQYMVGNTYQVYSNVYSGSAWGTEQPLAAAASASPPLSIAIASDGTGYGVTWQQFDGSDYRVYANIHNGSVWGGMDTLSVPGVTAKNPAIASNGNGYMLAWTQNDLSGNDDLLTSVYSNSQWSAEPASIEAMSQYGRNSSIASNGTGYGVGWLHGYGIDYDAYFNFLSGTGWAGETLIESSAVPVLTLSLYGHGSDYLALWVQENSSNEGQIDIWANVLP